MRGSSTVGADPCVASCDTSPTCLRRNTSLPEGPLWRAIKGRKVLDLKFRRQHPIGPYVLDFYCDAARPCVEVDGGSHGFGDHPWRDEARDAWLAAKAIRTLRL